MAHLPPVGWADVATKEYVDHRAEAIEGHIESAKFALTATMERGFRRQAMWIATLFAAQASVQFAMVLWAVDRLAP